MPWRARIARAGQIFRGTDEGQVDTTRRYPVGTLSNKEQSTKKQTKNNVECTPTPALIRIRAKRSKQKTQKSGGGEAGIGNPDSPKEGFLAEQEGGGGKEGRV